MFVQTIFLLTILLILCRNAFWSRLRFYWLHLQLSGPWGLPIIGIAFQFMKTEDVLPKLERYAKKYKSPFITWMGTKCILYCGDPVTVETVLNSSACTNKGFTHHFISQALGDGLLTSSSPRYNKHRRLLNPSYNRSAVNNFLTIFNQEANTLVSKLFRAQNQSLDIYEFLKRSVLETSFRTAIDKKMKFQNDNLTFILDAYHRILTLGFNRMLKPWLYLDFIYRHSALYMCAQKVCSFLHNLMENFLQPTAESKFSVGHTLKQQNPIHKNNSNFEVNNEVSIKHKPHVFVNHARNLVNKKLMSLEDAITEANVIVSAAFETSATSLYFVCLCLAMHPSYQDKLYNELMELFPNRDNSTMLTLYEVTPEHLAHMTYTEMVINETMRLFAPIPLIMRISSTDITLKNGVTVPGGTQLLIDIFNMHRNEDIWGPYACSFAPEIHFGPSSSKPHSFAFVPFAKGLRMCVGYHYAVVLMKVMIAKLFRNFYFTTDAKISDLKVKPAISLKLCHYPLLKVMKR